MLRGAGEALSRFNSVTAHGGRYKYRLIKDWPSGKPEVWTCYAYDAVSGKRVSLRRSSLAGADNFKRELRDAVIIKGRGSRVRGSSPVRILRTPRAPGNHRNGWVFCNRAR